MYLGHRVSEVSIEPDTKKTEAILKWSVPKTLNEIFGFINYC